MVELRARDECFVAEATAILPFSAAPPIAITTNRQSASKMSVYDWPWMPIIEKSKCPNPDKQ